MHSEWIKFHRARPSKKFLEPQVACEVMVIEAVKTCIGKYDSFEKDKTIEQPETQKTQMPKFKFFSHYAPQTYGEPAAFDALRRGSIAIRLYLFRGIQLVLCINRLVNVNQWRTSGKPRSQVADSCELLFLFEKQIFSRDFPIFC
jgi:hypothetical protein